VFTSDIFGSGTDANVFIVLVGEIAETGKLQQLIAYLTELFTISKHSK